MWHKILCCDERGFYHYFLKDAERSLCKRFKLEEVEGKGLESDAVIKPSKCDECVVKLPMILNEVTLVPSVET